MKKIKGFTLVELLVVISIISILSSVVLVSLNSARTKGVNARIQQEIFQIRNEFELNRVGDTYPDLPLSSGTSGTSVTATYEEFTNAKIIAIIADILSKNGGVYAGGLVFSGVTPPCLPNLYGTNYYGAGGTETYYSTNGFTIYVAQAGCSPKKSYAIYAEKAPIINTRPATLNTADYAGYYCVDSTGASMNTSTGWIPSVLDGKCH